ncbi:TetR/AcrR family transcriptional regulator [Nanchangia anserum]|uniref:TetR/AcrR family transcriptional regulator n=1 Tax=Nanchangia anserum TaxID=2692125 RepID=A0A8I0GDH2_9ACTO|nr:TetR/AcrR family transcriptional regulator [Nanchangia anserum]MBD3689538.1 TetR/AcrR family transcriptional regulator [Nanchangia anserum]QOX81729.1 TetR/AcrR family transcriptional regulator [Nanchangia anserum]
MRRKEARANSRLDTQDRLIAACRDVIVTEGAENCSVEKICHRAGFTRGAFYSNFSTKEELFAALAEEEYTRLADTFTQLCERWRTRGERVKPKAPESEQIEAIRRFLFEAIDSIGFGTSLYLIHTELMTRAVRDPAWGVDLSGVNKAFIDKMSEVVVSVLHAAGRELTTPVRPIVHSAIAIILRGAAIHEWRDAARRHHERELAELHARAAALGITDLSYALTEPEDLEGEAPPDPDETGVAGSFSRDIIETLVLLLFAASAPRRRRLRHDVTE